MADFYGNARSNYFDVKDGVAFENAMSDIPSIEVIRDNDGLYGVLVSGDDFGCFPSWMLDEDDNDIEIDIAEIVSTHLADGAVAIFMEVGAEKLRYVSGWAEAINSKGERKSISLNNIYDLAAGLSNSTKEITRAEY